MCDCANRTFFALRCYQSKLSPAIIKVFVHILKFSPAKKHNVNFLLSYFSVTKSTKSQQGGLTPSSFRTTGGVHELVAGSSAWQVRAAQNKAKIGSFAAPHDFSYTTRANISHEKAEQIRARIVPPTYKYGRRRRPYFHFSVFFV